MRLSLRAAVFATMLLIGFNVWGQNAGNPIQLALLRWYSANVVTQFSPCSEPQGLFLMATRMWVGCGGAEPSANTVGGMRRQPAVR